MGILAAVRKKLGVLPEGCVAVDKHMVKDIIKALKSIYIDERNFEHDYFGLVKRLEEKLKEEK